MEENKNIKKNKVIKVVALLGVFLMVFGASYALFSVVLTGKRTNSIDTANFGLKITDKNGNDETEGTAIDLEDALPISAEEAMTTIDPYEFNVVNTGSIMADYELYLETSEDTDLDPLKIKYNLVRTDTGEVLSMNDVDLSDESAEPESANGYYGTIEAHNTSKILERVETTKDGKTVYKLDIGTIQPGASHKYSFRIWIAYAAGVEVVNKTFDCNIKVYGVQPTKDSVYATDMVDFTEYRDDSDLLKNMPGYKLYAKIYSDNSIRFEGYGEISSVMISEKYPVLMSKVTVPPEVITDINAVLTSENLTTYDDFSSFISAMNAGSVQLSEAGMLEIESIMNNIQLKNYDLYIGGGITKVHGQAFEGQVGIENLYISTLVGEIGFDAFANISTLKEVTFVENEFGSHDLHIREGAFRNNEALTKVTILENLKYLGFKQSADVYTGSIFSGSKNVEVAIEALQSNVKYSEADAFKDVKSVTWING